MKEDRIIGKYKKNNYACCQIYTKTVAQSFNSFDHEMLYPCHNCIY